VEDALGKVTVGLALLLLLPLNIVVAQSSFPLLAIDDSTSYLPCSKDGTPQAEFIHVVQYFPKVAVGYRIGETHVKHADGDTIDLRWNVPMTARSSNVYLKVFHDSTDDLLNDIITLPFSVEEGDSLIFFRDFMMEFPQINPVDRSDRSFVQDTSEFDLPCDVSFVLELIDVSDGSRRAVVDSVVFPESHSWWTFGDNMVAVLTDSTSAISTEHPLVTVFGTDADPGTYRLRVRPLYHPRRQGDRAGRNMYYTYSLQDRVIGKLSAVKDSLVAAFVASAIAYGDSIEHSAHMRNQPHRSAPQAGDVKIFPTHIHGNNPILSVHGVPSGKHDSIRVSLHSMDGNAVKEWTHLEGSAANGTMDLRIPTRLNPGSYLVLLGLQEHHVVQLITVF